MAKMAPRAKFLTITAFIYAVIVAVGMYNTGAGLLTSAAQGVPVLLFGALFLGVFLFVLFYLADIFLETFKDVRI